MDNITKLYWITRLDSINNLFLGLMPISLVVVFIFLIGYPHVVNEHETVEGYNKRLQDYKKSYRHYFIKAIWTFCISMLVLIFLPTRNEVIAIYAGGKTLDFAQQDSSLAKTPAQTTEVISNYLDKVIKEGK